MNKAKYLLCVVLFGLFAMLTSCKVEDGDERPRRTQGEYSVYSSVYVMHARAIENLRLVVGFDAYLRQTTDSGRAAIIARFFSWAKIIVPKEYGWRLQDNELGNICCDFIIKDALLLGEPGASWLCYRRYSSETAMSLICDLSTEGDAIRYKGLPLADSRVDWLTDVTLTDGDFSAVFSGDSSFEYKSDRWDEDRWTVDCRTDAPLHWSDRNGKITKGSVSVMSQLAAQSPRQITFKAEHIRGSLRITAQDGYKELWLWTD